MRFTSSSGAGRRPIEAGAMAAFSLFKNGKPRLPLPGFCLDARVGGVHGIRRPRNWPDGFRHAYLQPFCNRVEGCFYFSFSFQDIPLILMSEMCRHKISFTLFIRFSKLISVEEINQKLEWSDCEAHSFHTIVINCITSHQII